jgi:DNA-binding PadR family transcriptional regulator
MYEQEDSRSQKQKKEKHIENNIDGIENIWKNITENYEMIERPQLSNSFIILLTLKASKKPMSSADISKTISAFSLGKIYKPASTLKDSLEKRLKREGYVESSEINKRTLYSMTEKGTLLLNGWISFLDAFK